MMVKRSNWKKCKRSQHTSYRIFIFVFIFGALILLSSLSCYQVQGFESDSGSPKYGVVVDYDTGGGGSTPPLREVTADFNHTPEIGVVGEPMIFNASNSSVSDPQSQVIESYLWNFGDGTTDEGMIVEHTFSEFGCFNVTLQVIDNYEINDTTNDTIIVIPKQVSNISIHDPHTGDMLILRWNESDASNISYYQINRSDLDEPILWQTSPYTDTDVEVDQTYTYILTAIGVVDGVEYESRNSEEIQAIPLPPNVQPTAHAGGPYNGKENEPIQFDGSQSTDNDGNIETYSWDFGNGETASGPTPIYAYTSAGSYTVTLAVTDDLGVTNTYQTIAIIKSSNKKPTAQIDGSHEGHLIGETISFSALGSTDDGTIVQYHWDLGDGTVQEGSTITHTYENQGTFSVCLTVTDNNGARDAETILVHILKENEPPKLPEITMHYDEETGIYRINISSNDTDNDTIQYSIDWGDNTTTNSSFLPNGMQLRTLHTWKEPGLYNIKITARDSNNQVSETKEILVLKTPTDSANEPSTAVFNMQEDNQAESFMESEILEPSSILNFGLIIIIGEIAVILAIVLFYRRNRRY